MVQALEVYAAPEPLTLSNGSAVEVKKVTLRTLNGVLAFVEAVFEDLKVTKSGVGVDVTDPLTLLQLIAKHTDATYAVAASLCSLSQDELLDAQLDDAVKVILAIIVENRSFFMQKVLPLIKLEALESPPPKTT